MHKTGLKLKLVMDELPEVQVIATRYSSLELANRFFWRTQGQQEIDYVEERDGFFLRLVNLSGTPGKKVCFSAAFTGNYAVQSTEAISPDNFEPFLGVE